MCLAQTRDRGVLRKGQPLGQTVPKYRHVRSAERAVQPARTCIPIAGHPSDIDSPVPCAWQRTAERVRPGDWAGGATVSPRTPCEAVLERGSCDAGYITVALLVNALISGLVLLLLLNGGGWGGATRLWATVAEILINVAVAALISVARTCVPRLRVRHSTIAQ